MHRQIQVQTCAHYCRFAPPTVFENMAACGRMLVPTAGPHAYCAEDIPLL